MTTTLASGSIDLKSLKVAGEGANKYITEIGSDGIKIHDGVSTNPNYVSITSTGMEVYQKTNSTTVNKVAEFKSYITLGTRAASSITGANSIAMGTNVAATGIYSLATGHSTTASGDYSHAEGWGTIASGVYSHAEGSSGQLDDEELIASGYFSHAEGFSTQAIGRASHTGGQYSKAKNDYSFAHGLNVISAADGQVVFGKYNEEDSDALFIIGNGSSSSNKSNVFSVNSAGNIVVNSNFKIIDKNNPNDYLQLNSSGFNLYRSSSSIASFSSSGFKVANMTANNRYWSVYSEANPNWPSELSPFLLTKFKMSDNEGIVYFLPKMVTTSLSSGSSITVNLTSLVKENLIWKTHMSNGGLTTGPRVVWAWGIGDAGPIFFPEGLTYSFNSSTSFSYSLSLIVSITVAYVEGLPIPNSSISLINLASVYLAGGFVKCCSFSILSAFNT